MPDMRCPVCGVNTPEGKFCEHCGSSLGQVPPQAPLPQPTASPSPQKARSPAATVLIIIGIIAVVLVVIVFASAVIYAVTILPDTTTVAKPTATWTYSYTYSPTSVSTYTPSSSRSWHVVNSYTETIKNGYYWYYYIPLKAGDSMRAVFNTDGAPLDLMVMNSANFKKYQAAISSPPGTWDAWNDLNIAKDQYDFTAPSADTYYFVFDNTNSPTNGAYAKQSINLAATFSKYY